MSLLPIFLIVLVDLLGMMMIIPLLPFYAEKFAASPFEIGLLSASFSFCQLFASPVLGHLSDRVGRKPVLLLSQIGTLLGFILMVVANQLWLLFLARMIDGATAGNLSMAQAYVADTTEAKDRAKAFGILGVALGIGLLLGPAISGWLAGYQLLYPVYAAIGLALLSIVATVLFLPSTQRAGCKPDPSPKSRSFLNRPQLTPLLIQFSFYAVAFGFFSQGLGLFLERQFSRSDGSSFGPSEVGYLFAYCGLLGVIIQGAMIGRLVSKWGEARLVRFAFLVDVVGYAMLGFSGSTAALLVSSTIFSYGNSTLRPTLTSLVTQKVSQSEQGAVLGLTTSLQCLGQIVGPPLGGLLIQNQLLSGWALTLAVICAIPLLFRLEKDDNLIPQGLSAPS